MFNIAQADFCFFWEQEEDVNMVEHGGRLSVCRQPDVLPFGSAGVWRAWLVEAGPKPTSDP